MDEILSLSGKIQAAVRSYYLVEKLHTKGSSDSEIRDVWPRVKKEINQLTINVARVSNMTYAALKDDQQFSLVDAQEVCFTFLKSLDAYLNFISDIKRGSGDSTAKGHALIVKDIDSIKNDVKELIGRLEDEESRRRVPGA
ncbi:hypothetical protein [Endozoicomonas sp. Mp262]|uniref:hypothetical protein n=1 Tax=Endozoicomonas sp. Mp262 TaxID=2919499 RepID=UPI0021D7F2B3